MDFDFSDGQNLIPAIALTRGPDVLRPSSVNARHGQGQTAFFYTRFSAGGKRLFVFPAADGHEKHITEPEILKAMFGPELAKIEPEITYIRTLYDTDPITGSHKESGMTKDYDHLEVRRRAMPHNLIGRTGQVKGVETVMLWGIPENGGWAMLNDVIDQLHIDKDARIVNGTVELGPVWKFQEKFEEHSSEKKAMPVNQDTERIMALSKHHSATGAEKEALKKQYGFEPNTLHYPDDPKSTDNVWKRGHWKMKAKQVGVPNPFDYGETVLAGFAKWLVWLEGGAV